MTSKVEWFDTPKINYESSISEVRNYIDEHRDEFVKRVKNIHSPADKYPIKIEGIILEHVYANLFGNHTINFNPGSKETSRDFDLNFKRKIIRVSCKSGSIIGKYVKVSGPRLGKKNKCETNEDRIIFLNDKFHTLSDVTLSTCFTNIDGRIACADIRFIVPSLHEHIDQFKQVKDSVNYQHLSKNGIITRLYPSCSHQIWWEYPNSLLEKTKLSIQF